MERAELQKKIDEIYRSGQPKTHQELFDRVFVGLQYFERYSEEQAGEIMNDAMALVLLGEDENDCVDANEFPRTVGRLVRSGMYPQGVQQ